jgi:glycosyltransferase involved in cell wall biosynthesis
LFTFTEHYLERLKDAEYFCLFSKSEGCSYAMLEAIALNKKIICTQECVTSNMQKYPNIANKFSVFDVKETQDNEFKCVFNYNYNNLFNNITSNISKYKINIITCCFNTNIEHIRNLENSLYNQTLQDWLWIIIDDGSNNKNLTFYFNELQQKHTNVLIYSNSINLGLPTSRNIGWNLSTAEYLLFIDDDDYIVPTALEKFVWYLSTNDNIHFVYSFYKTFEKREILFEYKNDRKELNLYENGYSSCFMIRSNVNIRFDTKLTRGCEDWDFFLNCIFNKYLGFCLYETLFFYREKQVHNRVWDYKTDFKHKYKDMYNNPNVYFKTIQPCSNAKIDCKITNHNCFKKYKVAIFITANNNDTNKLCASTLKMLKFYTCLDHIMLIIIGSITNTDNTNINILQQAYKNTFILSNFISNNYYNEFINTVLNRTTKLVVASDIASTAYNILLDNCNNNTNNFHLVNLEYLDKFYI